MQADLYSSNLTDDFRIGINPFTGEEVRFALDSGLSELQLSSVRKYLNSLGAYSAEDDTYVYVPIEDGRTLRLSAPSLLIDANPVGYSLEWDFITPRIAEILFNLCIKSGMVLRHELDSVLYFSETNIDLVRLRWKNVHETQSAETLLEWLLEKCH